MATSILEEPAAYFVTSFLFYMLYFTEFTA